MTSLWRLHVRPNGGDKDARLSTAFCLEQGIVGMGWAVPNSEVESSADFEWYKAKAQEQYDGNHSWYSVWRFAEAEVRDLVWFRDVGGRYYLAELIGPWAYCYSGAHVRADIVNFRKARIVSVGLADAVPGKIIACFRPTRTFQSISAPGMLAFAQKLMGSPITETARGDLFDYLNDADIENIVFVYLQREGWYVLPGTRRRDTPHYEFVLVNRATSERAIVQVKSGGTSIDASSYQGPEKAFLFAACGKYGTTIPRHVTLISRDQLIAFMRDEPKAQTSAVKCWIDLVGLPS